MTKILNQIRSFLASDSALRIVIYLGVILYIRQYFLNRSLWLDEAMLSLSIIESPIKGYLQQPLVFNQAAPFGFLLVEKILINLFGSTEAVLRLFPFFCGIVSLWLFARMAKIYLQGEAVVLAVLAFVVTPSLIYYSSEVKPYYVDLTVLLFSYVVLAEVCLKKLDYFKSIIIGLFGVVLIWFSFPSVFVMFSIGLVLVLYSLIEKDWYKFLRLSIVLPFWFLSFVICYFVLLHNIIHIKAGEGYWKDGYASFADASTWLSIFNNLFKNPLGILNYVWLAGVCFVVGGYALFKDERRKFCLLLSPLVFVFLASGLHKYSCKGRLALFLIPILILVIVRGIGMIALSLKKISVIVALLLVGVLFWSSFSITWAKAINPKGSQELRPVLFYIKDHAQKEDGIYLYQGSEAAYRYYRMSYNMNLNNYIVGSAATFKKKNYLIDLNKMRTYKRVWVVFSHIFSFEKPHAKEIFLKYLDSFGKKIDRYTNSGASVYLYEFTQNGV